MKSIQSADLNLFSTRGAANPTSALSITMSVVVSIAANIAANIPVSSTVSRVVSVAIYGIGKSVRHVIGKAKIPAVNHGVEAALSGLHGLWLAARYNLWSCKSYEHEIVEHEIVEHKIVEHSV